MTDNKNKVRQILNIVFACVAVGAAVVTFLLTPFGRRLTGKAEITDTLQETEFSQSTVPSAPSVTYTETVSVPETTEAPSFSVPHSTEPTIDPYKNYTLFIDRSTFDSKCETGVTTLTAKGNSNVKMTITPLSNVSYTKLCADTKKSFAVFTDKGMLKIESLNSCYRSQTGDKDDDVVTTVYCIDDGKGGSIEIKYQYPVIAKEYEKDFDILLSMFKVTGV